MNVSLLFTDTGLCFSLFTNWRGFRFYWVLLKWGSFLLLSLALTILIIPAVNSSAALSDALRPEALSNAQYLQARSQTLLFIWCELMLLVAIVILSVFKPWGIRRQCLHVNCPLSLVAGAVLAIGVGFQLFMSESELDEMSIFVQKKANQQWLWHAIDRCKTIPNLQDDCANKPSCKL